MGVIHFCDCLSLENSRMKLKICSIKKMNDVMYTKVVTLLVYPIVVDEQLVENTEKY